MQQFSPSRGEYLRTRWRPQRHPDPDCNGSLRLRPDPAPTLSARKTELDSSAIGLVVQCVIASVDLLFYFGGAVEIRFRDQNPNAVDSDAEWDISIPAREGSSQPPARRWFFWLVRFCGRRRRAVAAWAPSYGVASARAGSRARA